MSDNKNDGGPAFPVFPPIAPMAPNQNGMTLRDWFAGHALVGLIAGRSWAHCGDDDAIVAAWTRAAYDAADAMLRERARVRS